MPLSSEDLATIQNNLSSAIATTKWREQNATFNSRILAETGRTNVLASIQNYQKAQGPGVVLTFPTDRPKYFMMLDIAKYTGPSGLSVTFNSLGAIVLPIPTQLIDGHEVVYTEEQLGLLVGGGLNLAAGTLGPGITSGSGGAFAGGALGSDVTGIGGPILDAFSAYMGLSPNQFTTILLKGPAYKRYHLNWKLAPKNFAEADIIREIIRLLENAQAPGLTAGGLVFKFPFIIQPQFIPNYRFLYRLKPSVLERISVNYAPGGVPAFYHDPAGGVGGGYNPPESVEITCEFLELEYWLRNDFLYDEGSLDVNSGSARTLDYLV